MRTLFACLLLTTPAFAQKTSDAAARRRALDATLVAMNDGNEVGEAVLSALNERKAVVSVEKIGRSSISRTRIDNGRVVATQIVLDEGLAPYPRVYAAHIAWQTAYLMTEDMPNSAEREYMTRSLAARAWLELGGDPAGLPKLETLDQGFEDKTLAAEFGLWLNHKAEASLEAIGKHTGTKTLIEMQNTLPDVQDPRLSKAERDAALEELARIVEANLRFVRFLIAEQDWLRVNAARISLPKR